MLLSLAPLAAQGLLLAPLAAHGLLLSPPAISSPSAALALSRIVEPRLCAQSNGQEQWHAEGEDDGVMEAVVFRKRRGAFRPYKPKDNRDSLLFTVNLVTPPERPLGTFRLDPNTGCGDIIQLAATGQAYLIKSVAYQYSFAAGAYRMVAKSVQVKEHSRDYLEKFMVRMLPESSGPEDVPEGEARS